MIDQDYLRNHQYQNAANLTSRMNLHEQFSTNKYGWHRWVFDQFDLPATARILELGSGPGWLWNENRYRIPASWGITLSDFSAGMLEETQRNLAGMPLTFKVIDAQEIPYPDASFDAVIANHMLYHVPNRAAAISEVSRVLKPDGLFYAATNGKSHMREIKDMLREVTQDNLETTLFSDITFALDNGYEQLAPYFSQVIVRQYEDALIVNQVEPLVEYMLSSISRHTMAPEAAREALTAVVQQRMAHAGAIRIAKSTGVFISKK
jgi:ubiquinone/menaquinone biosynthesis C-methylase UbiE